MAYDGSIKINTEIETEKASSKLLSLENRISKTADKIRKLKSEMDLKKEGTKVPTAEYKELQDYVEKTTKEVDKLIKKQEAMFDTGQRGSKEFEKLENQIELMGREIDNAKKLMEELALAGEDFSIESNDEEIAKLNQQLRTAQNEMDVLNAKYQEMGDRNIEQVGRKIESVFTRASGTIGQTSSKIGQALSSISVEAGLVFGAVGIAIGIVVKALTTLLGVIGKVASAIKSGLISAFTTLKDIAVSSLNAIGSMVSKLGNGIRSLVSGFVSMASSLVSTFASVTGISSAFSGISASIVTAISHTNTLNSQYQRMQNLIQTIQAQLGSAFTPLVEIALPYVQKLLSWVLNLVNAFSQFIALASGKTTWKKAVVSGGGSGGGSSNKNSNKKTAEEKRAEAEKKLAEQKAKWDAKQLENQKKAEERSAKASAKVEEQNTKALEKQAKAYEEAEEKANHYLSPLDEINKYTEKDKVADVDLEEFDPSDYAYEIQEFEGELADIPDDVAEAIGGGVSDGISYVEEAIGEDIKDLFDWLKDMWDKADFTDLGKKLAEELQKMLESIDWDKIKDIASKLGKSLATLLNGFFENKQLGYDLGKTLAEAINTAFEFLYAFLKNFDARNFATFLTNIFKGAFENIDWELIHNTFMEFSNKLADWIDEMIKSFPWDDLADFVTNALNTVIDSISNFFDRLTESNSFAELGTKLGETLRKIFDGIHWDNVKNSLVKGFEGAWDFFIGFIKGFTGKEDLVDVINSLFDIGDKAIDGINKLIKFLGSKLTEGLKKLTEADPETGMTPARLIGIRLGEQIAQIVENIDPQAIADFTNALMDVIGEALLGLWADLEANGTIDEFKDKINEVFENIDWLAVGKVLFPAIEIGQAIGNNLLEALGKASLWVTTQTNPMLKIGEFILKGILDGFNKDVETKSQESSTTLFEKISNALNTVFQMDGTSSLAMKLYGNNILMGLIDGFVEKIEEWITVIQAFFDENVIPWFSAEKWEEILQPMKDTIQTKIEEIKADLEEKWEQIKQKIEETWEEIKQKISEKIEEIKNTLHEKLESMKETWNEKWNAFRDTVSSIWDEIKGICQEAIDFIQGLIDGILTSIANVKSALATLGSGIGAGISKISGGKISIGFGSTKGFANGTVIPASHGEFMARVGDNNRETEVISPLSVIKQALHEELSGLTSLCGNGEITIKQYLDGTQIAESVVKAGRLQQMSTGTNMFELI